MDQPPADPRQRPEDADQIPRRRFLKVIGAVSGGVLAWRAGNGPALASKVPAAVPPSPLPRPSLPETYRAYPVPSYVPVGYELRNVFTDRSDGFGQGSEDLAFWFVDPKHPLGMNNAAWVHVARRPQKTSLACTKGRDGSMLVLSMTSGKTVQAKYHDGFWVPSPEGDGSPVWETRNVHSLTFELDGFTIGVRGARLAGVTFDELARIASSIG